MPLTRLPQPSDQALEALRAHAIELEGALREQVARLDRSKADLAAFKTRYQQEVGELHEQLEELEWAISAAELGEIARQRESGERGPAAARPGDEVEALPRFTSDAVRRLFRDVAKAIHPDLAGDELTRERRHALMIEANRAYALGDEERLRWVLQAWERSAEAVQGSDPESTRARLAHRIAQLEEQMAIGDRELAAIEDTALWRLKAMVDDAARRGKNLVAETVGRLKREIMVARNRLDAIQSRP